MGRWYLDPCLHANLLNFALMVMYSWMDYGRGFINSDPALLNLLYAVFGWLYVLDAALYLYLHQGELPWPSALTMTAEWLNFLSCVMYGATSLLYSSAEDDRSKQLAVLMTEALAASVVCASAVCGAAGWYFESSDSLDKEEVHARLRRGWRAAAAEVARAPYAWAHATNFLPGVICIGSAVAAAEMGYVRIVSQPSATDNFRMPDLLRQLARVYWYGDLLWLLNAVQWLVLWWHERGWEEEEEGGGDEAALLEDLLSPVTPATAPTPASANFRLQKERRTTPYYVGRPFVRAFHYFLGFCVKRETGAERRAALIERAKLAALGSVGASLGASPASPPASPPPPPPPDADGGGGRKGTGGGGGGRMLTFVAVTAFAAGAQLPARQGVPLGPDRKGDMELVDAVSFRRGGAE